MTHEEIRHARARLGLTGAALSALLGVDDRTLERWEADPDLRADAAEAPPWVGVALRALLAGFQPPPVPDDWPGGTMSAQQMRDTLYEVGLRKVAFAGLLGTSSATVGKWCARPGANTARAPNPVAARILWWIKHGLRLPGMGG